LTADFRLQDIFDLQDQVTARVVGEIAPKLEQAEIERAKRKPTESLDAYDYFLRGMANIHHWTRASNDEALRLFYKAIEQDSELARPMAWPLGVTYSTVRVVPALSTGYD
jgi:adenylate cyclase